MNFGKKAVEMSDPKVMSTETDDAMVIDGVVRDRLLDFLAGMLRIRCFEMKLEELSLRGALHGTMHLYIGQEATAVGALAARQPGDLFTSTHRGHGHSVAAGADLVRMFGEFLGKSSGYCRGRGGSMHIADVAAGNLGANGIVGGSIGIAAGAALVQQMKNTGAVVFCFFGDGAVNQGIFHESANLAAIWNLPVVFICENNQYGMSFHYRRAMRHEQISQRAAGYGFPGVTVDGNDVLAVFRSAEKARGYAAKDGPILLECVTYRWRGHSKSDANSYRTQEEIDQWKARCPIKRLRQLLIKEGILSNEEADEIDRRVSQEVDHALERAQQEDPAEPIKTPDEVYA